MQLYHKFYRLCPHSKEENQALKIINSNKISESINLRDSSE